jgi:hypothetical protein
MLGSCGAASLMLVGMVFAGNGKGYELTKAAGVTRSIVIDSSVPVGSGSVTLNGGTWIFASCSVVGSSISVPVGATFSSATSDKGYTLVTATDLSGTLDLQCNASGTGGWVTTQLNAGTAASIAMPTGGFDYALHFKNNTKETITFSSMTATFNC